MRLCARRRGASTRLPARPEGGWTPSPRLELDQVLGAHLVQDPVPARGHPDGPRANHGRRRDSRRTHAKPGTRAHEPPPRAMQHGLAQRSPAESASDRVLGLDLVLLAAIPAQVLGTAPQPQEEVQRRLLVHAALRERDAVYERVTPEEQPLLARRHPPLAGRNPILEVLHVLTGLHLQGEGLACIARGRASERRRRQSEARRMQQHTPVKPCTKICISDAAWKPLSRCLRGRVNNYPVLL